MSSNIPPHPSSRGASSSDAPAGIDQGRHRTDTGVGVNVGRTGGGAHEPAVGRREDVVAREKEQFGGVKVGSAFFGWLTATGTSVLLIALVAAVGGAVGLASNADPVQAASQAAADPATVGIVSGIVLLVVLLLAYFCGGYVAGRMARFNGAKQGVAVWAWAVVVAVVVAVLAAVAGSQFNVLSQLNSFPRLPIGEGQLTTGGIIAAVAAALVSLLGAVLGGLAGMRFHRKVDKAGLGA